MKKKILALSLSLILCLPLFPATLAAEDETYLISISTSDGVVTSGYGDNWRWVSFSVADPGCPGILLRGTDSYVTGSLKRSDGLTVGDALDAWGRAQDGKSATLTLGQESWACTARYKEYSGGQSVLYVEFSMNEAGTEYVQPDRETINLFRYGWAQETVARYAAALEELLQEEGYVVDRQLKSPSSVLVLRHKESGEHPDYELYWVAQLSHIGYQNPVKRLLLPSTALADGYAPTDKAPDSLALSEDGKSFTYTYSFPTPLLDGETVLHEAGSYVYEVDAIFGEVFVVHASGGQVSELARKLKALGLFLGDESGNFNLDKAPTRTEALVMLIRALGEESQAKAAGKTHPFTDVPAWADGYVSWGYAQGYTKGVSETEFGSNTTAGADMYLTFMLRALGYSDGDGGQFTWDRPYLLAYEAEILPFEADYVHFTRGDAVMVTSAALWADLPGTDKTLADRLAEQHFFTAAQFAAQFPSDPFIWEHSLKPLVDKALDEAIPTGQTDRKTVSVRNHIMTCVTGDGTTATVYALVSRGSYELWEDGTVGNYSNSIRIWQIDLSSDTGEVLHCGESSPLPAEEYSALLDQFSPSLLESLGSQASALLSSGEAAYVPPTYDQAVAELRSETGYRDEKTFETDDCTVFIFNRGGFMNAPTGMMTVIYKAGSVLGEGYVLELPHVRAGMRVTPADAMAFDPESGTFTYSYFHETTAYDTSIQGDDRRIGPGTVTFTVDLATGEIQREYRSIDSPAD